MRWVNEKNTDDSHWLGVPRLAHDIAAIQPTAAALLRGVRLGFKAKLPGLAERGGIESMERVDGGLLEDETGA